MTASDSPPKKAYFSTNNLDDTVCVLAMLQRIQSWQLYQAVLPRLEDDVECTTAALSKRVGLSYWRVLSALRSHLRMQELPLTTAVQTEHWILDLPRLHVIDAEIAPLGDDAESIQLVDAALADFLTPKEPAQHVPTESEIRRFLRDYIDGILKPSIEKEIERSLSISYSKGQATITLKTDKATASAISRHIDKAARKKNITKPEALEALIFNRTQTKVVINTYTAGGDTSRVYLPSAGWCVLTEHLSNYSMTRELCPQETSSYVPTEQIRAWVHGRDATCRWPGCSMPAHYCQLDHRVEYADGGPTSVDNLVTLCQHHHNVKTDGRARYIMDPITGDVAWLFSDGTFEIDRDQGPLAPRTVNWKQTWQQYLDMRKRPRGNARAPRKEAIKP